ncbi:Mg2+ transport system protein [Halanaeroarchaeum sp. HSR-CO]|uniref:MgtC/SapB family protein n=1 Tax=Halanaeroarchaeum sp. HSR-CO TaxID=2866382 RepID=UPI00217DCA05|nr:MgtC/SapB family protein [Halanaeroarchaeum sp. HSR-CO]UWG47015.1 Mg2+ transport system protein [Halanaeroarchaeum sp. HSR-CO]
MVVPVTDPLLSIAVQLFIAVGIGALVGLEREQAESGGSFAGSRTFPLIALYGAVVQAFFPAVLPVALAAISLPLTVAYAGKIWIEGDIGLTTLTAALLTVLLGALTTYSSLGTVIAIIVAGIVTVLLSAKGEIHGFVDQIEPEERRATIKFVLVAMVVFPLLPNRELEGLLGLNPQFVWLMVVFVSGLSFAAYVLSRAVGAERGIALTGLLGGFVSSTATTVSMANRTSGTPALYQICAFSTVLAAIVMFPRALIEVAVVNPALLPHVLVPLGAMTVVGLVVAGVVYWRSTVERGIESDIENPFRLRPALVFGALFALVLLVSEYANDWLGSSGVYATAFVSGLADVDAITLTLSKLAADGTITPEVATTGIVLAAIANTAVKAGLAWILGTRALGRLVTAVLGVVALAGVVLLFV